MAETQFADIKCPQMERAPRHSITTFPNPTVVFFKIIFLLLSYVVIPKSQVFNESGSTVVARWSPFEIYIGSDSKAITGIPGLDTMPICKIHILADSFVFAHTGDWTEPNGYNVVETAIWAVNHEKGIDRIAKAFRDSTIAVFHRLKIMLDPTQLQKRHIASAFIGLMNDTLSLYASEFYFDTINFAFDTVFFSVPSLKISGNKWALITLGYADSINKINERLTDSFWSDSIHLGIQRLIQAECSKNPKVVGKPISVLRWGIKSFEWFPPKRNCFEVKYTRN
jgi:hypothetical protein